MSVRLCWRHCNEIFPTVGTLLASLINSLQWSAQCSNIIYNRSSSSQYFLCHFPLVFVPIRQKKWKLGNFCIWEAQKDVNRQLTSLTGYRGKKKIKPGADEHLGLHFKLECFLLSFLSLSENLNLEICMP